MSSLMKVVPKKRLGQHFLRERGVLGRIVRTLDPRKTDVVLEVGAGDGALSGLLAPLAARLIAVEIDRECTQPLSDLLEPFGTALVIEADILKVELEEILELEPGAKALAVGNLPYNAATAIVQRFLDAGSLFERMIFMLQLEVAQRIVANPGSGDYGYLSVYCQYHAFARFCFKVRPECFVPRPAVTSAVVALEPRREVTVRGPAAPPLVVARAAFAHRRKMLANSLRQSREFGAWTDALLQGAGIDGRLRAEALTPEDYVKLGAELALREGAPRQAE